jgi:hypothetical protein
LDCYEKETVFRNTQKYIFYINVLEIFLGHKREPEGYVAKFLGEMVEI